jgi:hypothetical protein
MRRSVVVDGEDIASAMPGHQIHEFAEVQQYQSNRRWREIPEMGRVSRKHGTAAFMPDV